MLVAGIAALAAMVIVVVLLRVFAFQPRDTVKRVVLPANEYDPAVWGRYYPLEYRGYLKNMEQSPSPTGFGGSVKVQKSDREPEILMNFKGMPFSLDYSEDRGHLYSIMDLTSSKRVNKGTVGACMTCKTADLPGIYADLGWDYARTPLSDLLVRVKHPIACANCHDPATMNLRVVNPAFMDAMKRRGKDVSKASRGEMRSYVCGQCHSEYYFEPATKKVVFPWDNGLLPGEMYAYYAKKPAGFEYDWVHPVSGAKMLKAQHPDFEAWSGGVHGSAGVACADCHMPYMREKGRKYSSHWVTSPLKHIEASCTKCHDESVDWLLGRVRIEQDSCWQLQLLAGRDVAQAHLAVGKAASSGRTDPARLESARELLREAQWFWDLVASENAMGFHNPVQALNTLGLSIDMARRAASLAGPGGDSRGPVQPVR
jgi:nitrite reductase (cytochrome c-552)